jgi:hypothetical protein
MLDRSMDLVADWLLSLGWRMGNGYNGQLLGLMRKGIWKNNGTPLVDKMLKVLRKF